MALGCPGVVAIGGVFRNYRGFSKGFFCLNIGIYTAFVAELTAFIQAIDIAWEKGWKQLWIEMDFQATVQCVNNKNFYPPWFLFAKWKTCRFKMDRMQLHISHIYREGNAVADRLSKLGTSYHSLQWWDSFPSSISHLLSHDCSLPSYRFKHWFFC